jgi:hypothetical protein
MAASGGSWSGGKFTPAGGLSTRQQAAEAIIGTFRAINAPGNSAFARELSEGDFFTRYGTPDRVSRILRDGTIITQTGERYRDGSIVVHRLNESQARTLFQYTREYQVFNIRGEAVLRGAFIPD